MLFYGYVRVTEDVDLVVKREPPNLRRVHDWLVAVEARSHSTPCGALASVSAGRCSRARTRRLLNRDTRDGSDLLAAIESVAKLAQVPSLFVERE